MATCKEGRHPSLTVWEAQQLLHAWNDREALRARVATLERDDRCACTWSESGEPTGLCAAHQHVNNVATGELRARVAQLERAAHAVIRCNDRVCAMPPPARCPAQCQADAALRAARRDVPSAAEVRNG